MGCGGQGNSEEFTVAATDVASAGSGAGIRRVEHVNSIDVELSQCPSRQLVFAFDANPGLKACITGHSRSVARSSDGLIRVDVLPGTRHVRLIYRNALLFPSMLVALATLSCYLLLLFRERRSSARIRLSDAGMEERLSSSADK